MASNTPTHHDRKLPTFPKMSLFVCFCANKERHHNTPQHNTTPEYSSSHVIHSNNHSFSAFPEEAPSLSAGPAKRETSRITNKRIELVSTLKGGKPKCMLVIRSSGTESQEEEAGVTQERCGINFTDPLLSCRRGEERRGESS